jgi:peptide/nickel transport system permease protein
VTYVGRRIAGSLLVLFIASILVFVLVREFGANPARVRCENNRDVTCQERVEHQLGLDDSLPEQYVDYMGDFVQGDWGQSQRTDQSVSEVIGTALWETAQLAFWGVLFSAGIAVVVGVKSANRPYSRGDYFFTGLTFAGIAMPTFWLGFLVIEYFTYELQKLVGSTEPIFLSIPNPTGSGVVDYFRELALPVFVLSVGLIAGWSRYQRSAMLEELHEDYVLTARAKGLTRRQVVWKHAFRNSLAALVTIVALDAAALFGGLILTERVFSRPGMGEVLLDGLANGDSKMVLAWMLVTGAIVVLFNLGADLLYGALDPRVRVS